MGLMIFCLGCGYEHDNLWSCERARVLRERGPATPVDAMSTNVACSKVDEAQTGGKAPEIVVDEKPKKTAPPKRPGVTQELVEQAARLGLRLVPKRLEKQREHSKNWRKKRRTKG